MNELIEELHERIGPERSLAMALHNVKMREERRRQSGPGGLMHFIRYFWHLVEPARVFVEGWALEAMCMHLEAVDDGRIPRLLITVPPGSMKSLTCSVFFPLWQWGPRGKPHLRYMNFAYGAHLTQRDNLRMVQVLKSREWRELWGERTEREVSESGHIRTVTKGFTLTRDGQEQIANDRTGWKFATSVGGVGTGERGDCIILDDPHNIKDDKSEVVRPEVVRWFKEAMSNRVNDLNTSSIIAIMQRSHEADVAGTIIDDDMGYVHLNLPMEFEVDHRCVTRTNDSEFFWADPRTYEGELMWPERFDARGVARIKKDVGEHAWISQYQQRPEPRGGGLFKREYWKPYICKRNAKGQELWPDFEFNLASLDGAFTEDTENDPSALTIWGVFQDDEANWCAMLKHAWRKHLRLNGTARMKKKTESWGDYRQETQHTWGIVQNVRYDCFRYKVDTLLIENKASGLDIFHEMVRQSEFDKWALVKVDPKNLDKWARGVRVQPIFTDGLVYALANPDGSWKPSAQLTIDEMASFPRGRFRDITDTTTQALHWLRKGGFLEHHEMARERQEREALRRGKKGSKGSKALYPV